MNKSLHIVQTFGLHDIQGRTAHVANLTHSMVKLKHTPEIVAAAYNSNYPESLDINSVNVTYLKSNAPYRSLTLNVSAKDYLIKRVNRSYEEIYNLANKMDNLSLEKKRQLTIPLIKEIL